MSSPAEDERTSEPDSAPVRLLLAGAGLFGREHLARLVGHPCAHVVGVADESADALAWVRSRYCIANYGCDPMRMIDETPADAIVIATPADSHVQICVRALGANLSVLLEKPVAPSAAAATRLLAAAKGAPGFVLPGHVLRFSRDHQRLVDLVRARRIGEVIYVNSRRYRDDSHAIRYSETDPVLMTLVHDIDLAQWITGSSFRSVQARRSGGPGFRSMTTISATTATGVICELRTAWTFVGAQAPADRLEVVGTRGSVELVIGQGVRAHSEAQTTDYPADKADDPLRNEQDHFLACVTDRSRTPALGLTEAIKGLKLADAALDSLRLCREILISG
jgi:predicted dehydrogenase